MSDHSTAQARPVWTTATADSPAGRATASGGPPSAYDVERIREDFPILRRLVNDHRLVYLDSANTSQQPHQVVDAMREHQRHHNANVARSLHTLGSEATAAYEGVRAKVAAFIGARSASEVVFTKNATEALNLVAYSFGNSATSVSPYHALALGPGDEIVVSEMEHHSNIVPWQFLCQRTGATLRWLRLTADGRLDLSDLDTVVNERTRLVSFVHVSNILGTVNPTARIIERAKAVGAVTLLDASQSVPHMPIDVTSLGADLVAFTGHKMYGPTGVGVLWGRASLLEVMPPFLGGGSMIDAVRMDGSTFAPPPARFEGGTPPIVSAVGLGAAIDYLTGVGMDMISRHERDLTAYAIRALTRVPGIRIFGPASASERGSAVSFVVDGVDTVQMGRSLDAAGIQIRVGRHCAAPVCARYGVPAMARMSLGLYSTAAEVDALVEHLHRIR